jgi:hypothetical protein
MNHSISQWLLILALLVFWMLPTSLILKKAGFSPWWCLLVFVPVANFIAFWVFAFVRWPVEVRAGLR